MTPLDTTEVSPLLRSRVKMASETILPNTVENAPAIPDAAEVPMDSLRDLGSGRHALSGERGASKATQPNTKASAGHA